ncbi:hypothetical protein Pla108_35180 [Botrimarina colliarenosi]|uniref:Uncharacterized protein n=1 Tax=Botrimarina colliarenosi TaxID=2528001 RepID=A0A5C6A7K1_9BACT|nr:hypothetical protein [Botrimarina colliarenosi]TWT95370.1 hypothetical protein Pla108_35180 [Botrimarina colliarenosi]
MIDAFPNFDAQTVKPLEAAQYLRAAGWAEAAAPSDRLWIWHRTVENENFEVLLPRDARFRDYRLRLKELIQTLSTSEQRPAEHVFADIITIGADIIRIRIADPDLEDGSLPIEEHAAIAQKTRELVLAAACAATGPKAVWHTRRPAQAMDHVRKVRIGQSERGSYIVKVINRITPRIGTADDGIDEPFDRKVTSVLADSLEALRSASEDAALRDNFGAFDRAVQSGVSANLCDAVAGLWGGDENQRRLEFNFRWSPTRPVGDDEVRDISLGSDHVAVIREAGRVLRERTPEDDFEIRGLVTDLHRGPLDEEGVVTVVCEVEGKPRHVKLKLSGARYDDALAAHGSERVLTASGTLTKGGRTFTLENPHSVEILEEED